jgi:hypothetical protein
MIDKQLTSFAAMPALSSLLALPDSLPLLLASSSSKSW